MYRKTYAQIDLDAYGNNIKQLAKNANGAVMAVVKANAYGHGMLEISRAAVKAGATALAVALPEEAVLLREAGIGLPILVLGRANKEQLELSVELELEQCVFYPEDLLQLEQQAQKQHKAAYAQLKIDTGMGRIGMRTQKELDAFLHTFTECPHVELSGVFTHFSRGDEADKSFTHEQCERFDTFVATIRKAGYSPKIHASNSASCIDMPEFAFDYSRCGISGYGYYPSNEVDHSGITLKPVMQVFSEISQIKTMNKGEPIGYNATYVTPRQMQVATVQIGYGDGYSRLLSNAGEMLVRGLSGWQRAKIIGRVCMDQTMIDVTGINGLCEGDVVIVLGGTEKNGIWADEIANLCGTISYEILLSWSQRVPRVYIPAGEV